uniref:Si:dkey-283b15.2 n=1 Tax=Neogobius melanostomus TaxID=47308 RepID=A0A8C6WKF2_9GOBI
MRLSAPLTTWYTRLLLFCASFASSSNVEYDFAAHPRFVCTPLPVDADPSCFPNAGPSHNKAEEAKTTILHLRESLVQQKETILDQREAIRELTAKLALCEGFGHATHSDYHQQAPHSHHALDGGGRHRMLHALKERLENLQVSDAHFLLGAGPRAGFHTNKLETMLNQLHLAAVTLQSLNTLACCFSPGPGRTKSPDAFLISFPMRTNYMYGRVKKPLLQEIFAFTLCLWIKPGLGPGLGTPFSYSAPGQSNEIVLIEWGSNPIELLIDDKSVTLPLSLTDGKWHHVCVTWSTRDGHWEAYQDGVQRGSGENLSAWHAIKPGGVFILGQEQDTLGGRFDATQSFVGEMSEVQLWSHVLSASDIQSLASCGSHLQGDVLPGQRPMWSCTEGSPGTPTTSAIKTL